jgi:hypothetical protein
VLRGVHLLHWLVPMQIQEFFLQGSGLHPERTPVTPDGIPREPYLKPTLILSLRFYEFMLLPQLGQLSLGEFTFFLKPCINRTG